MDIYSSAQEFICSHFPDTVVLTNEPLSRHTSFRIGGAAAMLITPDSVDALCGIISFFGKHGKMPLLIGKGTNLLVKDVPLDFPVIKTHGNLESVKLISETQIEAECGISLAKLAVFAMQNSLTGLEFAHGIPGTLGGAVYMNAGAYGGEMRDVITSTTAYGDGNIYTVYGNEHEFSYRHSVFSEKQHTILKSVLTLQKGSQEEIQSKMAELSAKRRASQPLDLPSAGSTFKRPATGYAAAMIDQSGLKGYSVGGAKVSEKHAGFVVNFDNASFDDVIAVIKHVKNTVSAKFAVDLETEVLIIDERYGA